MSALSAKKMCRACLSTTSIHFYPIFEYMPRSNLNISEMLSTCSLHVAQNDGLPERLCSSCFITLESTYNFIEQFRKSDEVYQEELRKIKESEREKGDEVIIIEDEPVVKRIKQEKVEVIESVTIKAANSLVIRQPEAKEAVVEQVRIKTEPEPTLTVDIPTTSTSNTGPEVTDNKSSIGSRLQNKPSSSRRDHNSSGTTDTSLQNRPNTSRNDDRISTDTSVQNRHGSSRNDNLNNAREMRYLTRPNNSRIPCPLCDESMKIAKKVIAHLTTKHFISKNKRIMCNLCRTWCENPKGYTQHFNQRHKFFCRICQFGYKQGRTYRNHMIENHGARKFPCIHCKQQFLTFKAQQNHTQKAHLA